MPLTRISGSDIWVERGGDGADPTLMIHCSLAKHEALLPLLDNLVDVDATLFDLPGHGRSSDADQIDPQGQAVGIAAQLAQPGSHVIGHSFGATIALRLALEHPHLVRRLTLIEPVMFGAVQNSATYRVMKQDYVAFNAALADQDFETAARMFMRWWGDGRPWADLPDRQRAGLMRRIPLIAAARGATDNDIGGMLVPGRLEVLQIPVTLIAGADTHPLIPLVHQALAARLPNATSHVIPEARHMVAVTHAAQVARIISEQSEKLIDV